MEQNIVVDPEIKGLIPPLREEECKTLEENLLKEGCRDKLIVWRANTPDGPKDILLDGHHRLEICKKHDIPFQFIYAAIDPEDRDGAKLWVIKNQMGRRNLTPYQRAELALKLKPLIAKEARKRMLAGKPLDPTQNSAGGETRDRLAKVAGVSHDTIHKAAVIAEKAPEEVKEKLRRGDDGVSIHKVYSDIVREEKRKAILEKLEDIDAKKAKAIQGLYDVIVIDPPWPMKKIEREVRPNQSEFDYPIMSLDEIKALRLPCAEDCHVFLWTTEKFLPEALKLFEAWKVKYILTFVWHKPGGFQPFGLPQYNAEFVLYGRLGNPEFIDTEDFPVCFNAPRGKHSEKPQEFYDTIRRVTAGRRLDMFSRRHIEGFDSWGKEI